MNIIKPGNPDHMNETRFLDGKVKKRALPVIVPPFGAEVPVIKRLLLPQGELAQFFDGEPPMRYLATIELRPGTIRGNHFHREKEEWLYVISGALVLTVQDGPAGKKETFKLSAGELAVVPAGIAHVLQPKEPGFAIEFSPRAFDPADTFKTTVVGA
jgi:quercetin dioxygenase-like cupin family protein